MTGAKDDIVGLYWTISGPVEVHFGREWCLFDIADRCVQAERVGFKGIGLWHADLEHLLETRTLADVEKLLDDHGLEYLELEFLGDWFLDLDDERRRASDKRRELLFRAAAELPAHHIKVGNITGTECELPQIVERYAEPGTSRSTRSSTEPRRRRSLSSPADGAQLDDDLGIR